MRILNIYGTDDEQEIKIGTTGDRRGLEKRKAEYEVESSKRVFLTDLAYTKCTQEDENTIQDYWRANAVLSRPETKTEWYVPNKEMRDWIRYLRTLDCVADTMVDASNDHMFYDGSLSWLPSNPSARLLDHWRFKSEEPWSDLQVEAVTSGDYYTPSWVIDRAKEVMGSIDFDPASCKAANKIVRATQYLGYNVDGLTRKWHGNVWCNPPFGEWDRWANKIVEEIASGRIRSMLIVAPLPQLNTLQFQCVLNVINSIWIPYSRINYEGPKAKWGAYQSTFILYYGNDEETFYSAFNNVDGRVWKQHQRLEVTPMLQGALEF